MAAKLVLRRHAGNNVARHRDQSVTAAAAAAKLIPVQITAFPMAQQGMAGVSGSQSKLPLSARVMNCIHARLATIAAVKPAFASEPQPRTIGFARAGQHLVQGQFQFAGHLVPAPGRSVWTILPPSPGFARELQEFLWLDDLVAVGDDQANGVARAWTYDWIARFGRGTGPGWTPDLTGRRLIRLIHHGALLTEGQAPLVSAKLLASMARQALFVNRRWQSLPPGLPRAEALVALILAGATLQGQAALLAPATSALSQECDRLVGPGGAVPSRNPEELLDLFSLLVLATQVLAEAGQMAGRGQMDAIGRIAPTLRALRHADGSLARFHGGGRGIPGRLDQALAASAIKPRGTPAILAMGFARMSAGRTSVIVDAAPPPAGAAARTAHASTLAMEVTSGRRPLIVNCGSGLPFGTDWARAGRATASHSTLAIDGLSSSHFRQDRPSRGGGLLLSDPPARVNAQQVSGPSGISLIVGHDGFVPGFGLTHVRRLNLSFDGRSLVGEDTLGAMDPAGRKRLDKAVGRNRTADQGLRYVIRFHLHPDVEAGLEDRGASVLLALKSGEHWQFRPHGGADLALEPSVLLEKHRLKPRHTKQIVLTGVVTDYAGQVSWTLAKTKDTPQGIRDLEPGSGQEQD